MANNNNGRVLQRMGARELALEEIQKVRGAALLTLLSVIVTHTPNGGIDDHLDS